ncbi:MAG: sugar ABC transporter permease [Proteobacteria bacterium]|nr:sugar ABC transporter permease [Pseudomonadota bacterium]
MGRPKVFVGLDNYVRIFRRSPEFWLSLYRTLLFTVFMVAGEFLVGFLFALVLARGFKLQKLLVAIVIAPIAVSPVVAMIIWKYLLAPNYGLINYALTMLGASEPDWFTNPTLIFIIITIIDIWINAPFVFIMIYPALLSISPELKEAAQIDGASSIQLFFYITLPSIKQVCLTAIIFRVIFALRIFENIWLFARGGPGGASRVLSIYLYEQAFTFWNFGMGSSIAWILLVLTMVLVIPQLKLLLGSYESI